MRFTAFTLILTGVSLFVMAKGNAQDKTAAGSNYTEKEQIFISDNDHAPSLDSLSSPLLAIWGENDLLVPPQASAENYRNAMQRLKNRQARIEILAGADHTLTYNNSGRRAETNQRRESFREEPAKILAPGYLDLMLGWLRNFTD